MISASAPGKIILFGEHSVVYGRPALAVPVMQVAATATITEEPSHRKGVNRKEWQALVRVEAPDIGLSSDLQSLLAQPEQHPLAMAVTGLLEMVAVDSLPALCLRITSTIPVASGLGSGAAVSVAIIRALAAFLNKPLADRRISTLAYKVEKIHHGNPSGIDNTVITFARPVYFIKDHLIEPFHAGKPFTIVIADTGISAPTKDSVGDVQRLWKSEPARWNKVFDAIEDIVKEARQAIESGNVAAIGPLMDENHDMLQMLTVSSPELDRLVLAARRQGALGAKLSGGGRGGNMIALAHKEHAPAIAEALLSAGAKRTIITSVETL
jgi:mevalonate kinase